MNHQLHKTMNILNCLPKSSATLFVSCSNFIVFCPHPR
jgi:hypothetical protein